MKQTKHLLATMAVLLCSLTASAHDFEVYCIYYNITSSTDLTVEVTYRGSNYYFNEYSGAVTIPSTVTYNGNTYSVTSIGSSAFQYCSSLTAITIPESVTSIGEDAFYYCYSLTSITIPEGVTSIGNAAFQNCSSLTAINIPESVTSIGGYAFSGCGNLTAITLPEGVTSIGEDAFYYCSSLTAITIPEGVTSIEDATFGGCSSLTTITIPESSKLTSIGDGAFANCSSLTSITIPEGVTSIGSSAFNGCSLESITVDADNTVYDSRNGCNAIIKTSSNTLITGCAKTVIPASVTSIGSSAFSDCSSLTTITIPEGVTSIGSSAFSGCSSLTAITIPEGVTSIGSYAFCGCESLTTITIPEGVTSIGEYAFCDCSNLTTVTIPEGVTSIGWNAFSYCSSLTAITIPESVTSIEGWAFCDCSSLTTITIPKSVTSIGVNAFRACSSLTTITILENSQLTSIGMGAFENCHSLTTIICRAMIPPTIDPSDTFYNVDKSIPVYVSASSLSSYKTAAGWNEFTNIQAIPEFITLNQYGSGTYCSEYALDFSEVEGLKAYAATGYNTKTGIVTLTRVMTSKPGMGLFIKGEPGEYIVPTLEKTSDNSLNMLVGTLEQMQVNKMTRDGCYVNYKYTIYNDELKFWSFDGGFSLGAGKAYLQIPYEWVSATGARSIGIRFDEGGTTDIEDVELSIQHSELIYDLMGRRVASPQKGNLYIINGKKVIY